MAKKASKPKRKPKRKPPQTRGWRGHMTTDEALDHLQRDMFAKFDNLNRIILPLSHRIAIIRNIAQLIVALAKDDL